MSEPEEEDLPNQEELPHIEPAPATSRPKVSQEEELERIEELETQVGELTSLIEVLLANRVGEQKAETALAERDTSAAIRHYESVAGRKGASPQSYEELGRLYRAKNTIIGRLLSQRILEEGRLKNAEHPGITYELGLTYEAQGFYGESANCFRRVITSLDKNNSLFSYIAMECIIANWTFHMLYDLPIFIVPPSELRIV